MNNYNKAGWGKGGKKKIKSKRIYRISQNIRKTNVYLESLKSESFPLLGVAVHLTSLGCPPTLCWSLDLLWGQLRSSSGPTVSTTIRTSAFSFVGALNVILNIP